MKSDTKPGDQLLDSDWDSGRTESLSVGVVLRTQEDREESLILTPDEALWAAALQQAMEDATAPETSLTPGADKSTRSAFSAIEVYRRQARAFIFSPTATTAAHFADMCEILHVDPDFVRSRVSHMIRQGISFKRPDPAPLEEPDED